MKDAFLQIILSIVNIGCVGALCCFAGPPLTRAHGFLRALFIVCYFVTLILLSKGEDDDENNRGEDDDVQDM